MNYNNYFNNLDDSEDEKIYSPKNLHRKATKMIDQINKLKTKNSTELNHDQLNKLKTEYYWRKVLDPSYISHEEKCKIEDEKKRHYEKKRKTREKKDMVRNNREEKERVRKKILEQQQREREREQREREREQREREYEQREREYEQREREYEQREREREYEQREREREREQRSYNKKTMEEKKIDIEFNIILSQGKSFDYARKKILLKYHPDKNKNENANRITQIINNKCGFEYSRV